MRTRIMTRRDRRFMMMLTPCIAGVGVYVIATGSVGRGAPVPVDGPIPLIVGGAFIVAAGCLLAALWLRPPDEPPEPRPPTAP